MTTSNIYLSSLNSRLLSAKNKKPIDKEEVLFIQQLIAIEEKRLKNLHQSN